MSFCIHSFTGNYAEALNDAKIAVNLQPSFLKAFWRGISDVMGLSLLTQAIAKPEGKTFKRRLSHFSCFYKEPLSWFVVRRIGKKKLKMKNGCGGRVTWGKDILSSFLGYIWF